MDKKFKIAIVVFITISVLSIIFAASVIFYETVTPNRAIDAVAPHKAFAELKEEIYIPEEPEEVIEEEPEEVPEVVEDATPEEEVIFEEETYYEPETEYYYEEPVYYYEPEYYDPQPSVGSDFQSDGVWNDGQHRFTWYSSNVLYHYQTSEWTAGEDGIYRDADGYVVVASSDYSNGTVVEDTPFGPAKVYDSGCASGTLDVYVNW